MSKVLALQFLNEMDKLSANFYTELILGDRSCRFSTILYHKRMSAKITFSRV